MDIENMGEDQKIEETDIDEEPEERSFSYRLGEAIGVLLVACVGVIALALTAKFVFWLF